MTLNSSAVAEPRPTTLPSAGFPLKVRRILAPTDLSADSRKSLNYAVDLARHFNASLTVCHVMENPPPVDFALGSYREDRAARLAEKAEQLQDLANSIATEYPPTKPYFCTGDVVEEIVKVAGLVEADLIVISTHAYPWFVRLFSGSDAERIVRHAPCPVLIVRQEERDFVPNRPDPFPLTE
jgi:nucleotide-binding universal stress UspA family protein